MGGGTWLNGKTRGGSGGLLSGGGGGEDGGMERSETDVFVSVLEGIQRRGGRRQRAETHFCVHPSKSRQNRNFFMAGSCTAEANKAKPDGERLRQL